MSKTLKSIPACVQSQIFISVQSVLLPSDHIAQTFVFLNQDCASKYSIIRGGEDEKDFILTHGPGGFPWRVECDFPQGGVWQTPGSLQCCPCANPFSFLLPQSQFLWPISRKYLSQGPGSFLEGALYLAEKHKSPPLSPPLPLIHSRLVLTMLECTIRHCAAPLKGRILFQEG
ncbi:hypothetical protein BO82DRAFT_122977 [Aspergillus uvarum CBS 121591]|uniref:Uncharacterized protein n=1 Tax=Aspergillus uvarum CBS 121591 TaxID=1448315 RepID=A0A319C473_9EURO|nr:hypothetical protein BO82DRAFT_122977 [Aspergillus uvarum CBS 121591]PYH79985.1 hypothetical protein BO82DRAFT_122977 [Aspergillus uvarum CBS 121591]